MISASGMAEAGRIKHHIANNVENPNNTILMVGYCSPNSLGAMLKTGQPTVKIFGLEKIVKAEIAIMDSFSAHADYSEIIGLLKCQDSSKVKNLFLVHGEYKTQVSFKEKLIAEGFKDVIIPNQAEGFAL
jgi:metallo-beta-lactamase family protein